jgi:hypothetical protein
MVAKVPAWFVRRGRSGRVLLTVVAGIALAGLGVGVSAGIVASSSPPQPTPTVTILPNSHLRDLQQVTMAGTGFGHNVGIATAECQYGAVDESSCDLSTLIYTSTDRTGAFTLKRAVRRIITVAGQTIDCAYHRCVLGGGNISNLQQAAGDRIYFDRSVPPVATKVRVTPSKRLIDHKLVEVHGEGFLPGMQAYVEQCVASSEFGCEYTTERYGDVGDDGTFTIRNFAVERLISIFDNGPKTVDCANEAGTCVIEARVGVYQSVSVRVPLSFDPDVPPAVAALEVAPFTHLADLQEVTVTGVGFTPGVQITLEQCAGSALNGICDYANAQEATAGYEGDFVVTFPVHRVIGAQFGLSGVSSADCAAQIGACSLSTFGGGKTVSVALTFDRQKPVAVPAITVSPNTGLVDNQRVGVTLHGFAPLHPIEIVECTSKAVREGELDECDFSTAQLATTPAGGGAPTASMAVHSVVGGSGGLLKCASRAGNCVLVAFPYEFYAYGPYAATTDNALGAQTLAPNNERNAPRAAPEATLPGIASAPLTFAAPTG